MSSNGYLLAAFVVTWAIHIAYILYLGSRAKRLEQDITELLRPSGRPPGGAQ